MESRKGKKSVEEIVDGAVDNIFKKYDENNNDFIDYPEFCKLIADLNLGNRICQKEIDKIFQLLDVNGDGKVSKDELADAFIAVKSSNLWSPIKLFYPSLTSPHALHLCTF